MRIVGFDVGARRIGVAISDVTCTLARPIAVLQTPSIEAAVRIASEEVARLGREEDGVASIVIGLPRRLDGSPNDMTPRVQTFAEKLGVATGLPIVLQDERLTSRDAETLLAKRVKDWRERKKRIDSVAAAIILQEYLDAHPSTSAAFSDDDT